MRLFDIITPTYNNLAELIVCLKSLEKQTLQDFHVWVCVDGSVDGTCDYLKNTGNFRLNYSVLTHEDGENHGRSAARNLALPNLNSTYLVFIDSDLYVKDDFLQNHLELLKLGNTISVGAIVWEGESIWTKYMLTRGKHKYFKHASEIPYKYIETGNVGMESKIFIALKGFDEAFKVYGGEDTELAFRINKYFRVQVLLNQKAAVYGMSHKSLLQALQQRHDFAKEGMPVILKKHPEYTSLFNMKKWNNALGKGLYRMLPYNLIIKWAECKFLPVSWRVKMVHLLVFHQTYKGLHDKS